MSPNRPSCRPASASLGGHAWLLTDRIPPGRETIDDIDALLAALPPEIVAAIHALPDQTALIEVVLDLGRRPEARFPDSEVTLLDREITEADIAYVVEHIGTFGDDNRAGHRADAPPDQRDPQPQRQDRRADLPDRAGRLRHDRDHRRLRRDREVDPDHGPAGDRQDHDAARGRAGPRRRHRQAGRGGRHLERDRGRRRHPAPRHRQGPPDASADPVAPARGDDRGRREPHAAGHRHRRDRHRARGPGGPDDRRAGCPADRYGPRQQPRQPDAQPDPVRPHRRHPERDPRRRGGAPPADPEERPRAQGAADVRRHHRDPGSRAGHGPRRRRRDRRRTAARRPGGARAALARRGGRPSLPVAAAAVASRTAPDGPLLRADRVGIVVAHGAGLARRRRVDPGAARGVPGAERGARPGVPARRRAAGWRPARSRRGGRRGGGPAKPRGLAGAFGQRVLDIPFVAGEIADRGPLERGTARCR